MVDLTNKETKPEGSSNKKRPAVPINTESELLIKSKRRCVLCFAFNDDCGVKDGQIAHVNRNREENEIDNLAYLCLEHHNKYDSTMRLTKSIKESELKAHRAELYAYLENNKAKNMPSRGDERVVSMLNCIMQYIPFADLLTYANHFPHHFDGNLDGPGETWSLYKRANPENYPTTDTMLNELFDAFFDYQNDIEKAINSDHQLKYKNGDERRFPRFVYFKERDKYTLNNELPSDYLRGYSKKMKRLVLKYSDAYNYLLEHIKKHYPSVELRQYKNH